MMAKHGRNGKPTSQKVLYTMSAAQTPKPGQNPKFSPKEQALVDEANAKAEANGNVIPITTKVPTGVAHNATDKAPHTRRAVAQNKVDTKLQTAQQAVDDLLTQVTEADAQARASKRNDPKRTELFAAKTKLELEYLEAKKTLQRLKRESLPPEEKAAIAEKAAAKTPKVKATRAPAAEDNRKIVLVAKTNPYREGTKAYATFEMFRTHGTVAKARAEAERTGGSGAAGKYDIGYLRYASRDGHIKFQ